MSAFNCWDCREAVYGFLRCNGCAAKKAASQEISDLRTRLAAYESREVVATGWRVVFTGPHGREALNFRSRESAEIELRCVLAMKHEDARIVRVTVRKGAK